VTSIDRDGTRAGFDLPLMRAIREAVDLPVIASGGAGSVGDFVDVFERADSDAALAASLFHYAEIEIVDVKRAVGAFEHVDEIADAARAARRDDGQIEIVDVKRALAAHGIPVRLERVAA
jgi:imidazole glycerol phosphate synthase subunit HisF